MNLDEFFAWSTSIDKEKVKKFEMIVESLGITVVNNYILYKDVKILWNYLDASLRDLVIRFFLDSKTENVCKDAIIFYLVKNGYISKDKHKAYLLDKALVKNSGIESLVFNLVFYKLYEFRELEDVLIKFISNNPSKKSEAIIVSNTKSLTNLECISEEESDKFINKLCKARIIAKKENMSISPIWRLIKSVEQFMYFLLSFLPGTLIEVKTK